MEMMKLAAYGSHLERLDEEANARAIALADDVKAFVKEWRKSNNPPARPLAHDITANAGLDNVVTISHTTKLDPRGVVVRGSSQLSLRALHDAWVVNDQQITDNEAIKRVWDFMHINQGAAS
jgi:hypothetical protein